MIVLILVYSCTDSVTYITTYKIINETDNSVELRFYKSSVVGEASFVFKANSDTPGLILERILETGSLDTNNATDAYKADSVAVIFNGERIEAHTFLEPFDNSIMDEGDYHIIKDKNEYIYTITEANFNNATPCDWLCN